MGRKWSDICWMAWNRLEVWGEEMGIICWMEVGIIIWLRFCCWDGLRFCCWDICWKCPCDSAAGMACKCPDISWRFAASVLEVWWKLLWMALESPKICWNWALSAVGRLKYVWKSLWKACGHRLESPDVCWKDVGIGLEVAGSVLGLG